MMAGPKALLCELRKHCGISEGWIQRFNGCMCCKANLPAINGQIEENGLNHTTLTGKIANIPVHRSWCYYITVKTFDMSQCRG